MSKIKLEKDLEINEIFDILNEYYDEAYEESPLIPLIFYIRSILPKKGFKELQEYLKTNVICLFITFLHGTVFRQMFFRFLRVRVFQCPSCSGSRFSRSCSWLSRL